MNVCLRWSTISALNYNEFMKKEFENLFKKIKHEDKHFSSQQRDRENFQQNNESIGLNVLFSSRDSDEITLLYKSEHNFDRENKVLLLMINDDDDDDDDDDQKYYYFAVKYKLELHSLKVKMNYPVYLGMSILDISKTLMYKFWYDYIKPKYEDRAKLCYTDINSFIIHIMAEDVFVDISDYIERWFDASNYDENYKNLFK